MERRLLNPAEVYRFARRQGTKISVALGSGGLVSTAFVSGRVDTLIGVVGGVATAYVAYRIIKRPEGNRDEPKNK